MNLSYIVLFPIIPVLVVATIISRVLYKKTGNIWLGALINTLLGMRFNLRTGKPIIHNKMGGYSGPGILPVALRMVYQVSQAVSIPVIGMGGVRNAYDVIEMMYAGATVVQVGSENLIDPYACEKIINDLPRVMDELKINKLEDIIGRGFKNE
jgi:dihydroorotate dehydrogenase (NAD+) catalytic subunit